MTLIMHFPSNMFGLVRVLSFFQIDQGNLDGMNTTLFSSAQIDVGPSKDFSFSHAAAQL